MKRSKSCILRYQRVQSLKLNLYHIPNYMETIARHTQKNLIHFMKLKKKSYINLWEDIIQSRR